MRTCLTLWILLLALQPRSVSAIDYASVAKGYETDRAPGGFLEFSAKQGVPEPNTCAVRLAHALFLQDKNFFRDVTAKSGIEWHGLPVRADDLAIILNKKIGKAVRHESPDKTRGAAPAEIAGKKGILFFDKLEGWEAGTGHISLWDGTRVLDVEDGGTGFFRRGERLYFWPLR
jgi:hypothetical protein